MGVGREGGIWHHIEGLSKYQQTGVRLYIIHCHDMNGNVNTGVGEGTQSHRVSIDTGSKYFRVNFAFQDPDR